jgi:hypothetical protein
MLRTFIEKAAGSFLKKDEFMTIDEAQRFDQRPFRSMLIQEWISYKPGAGFHITRKGKAAWEEFRSTEIWRKNPELPLTAYFDPTAYKLRKPVTEIRQPSVSGEAKVLSFRERRK